MTSMKVIALDIETSNLDMDIDGLTFEDPSGWNTSCVAVHDHHRNGTFVYVQNPEELHLTQTENVFPFSFLASDLEEWFYSGYLLVTKNGSLFDLPIISKSVEQGGCGEKVARMLKLFTDAPSQRELDNGTFRDIPPRYIDICEYIRESTGVRRSLQSLIQGTFGLSESKLMSAADAPQNWAAGEHQKVLEYCASDARYTADLFYFGRREGRIFARDAETYSDPIQIKTTW